MIDSRNRTWSVLRESFIPVSALLVGLLVVVIYVQFEAGNVANRVTIINVGNASPDPQPSGDFDSGTGLEQTATDLDFSPALESAKELFAQGNWSEAEQIYLASLQQGESSRLLTELARIYLQQSKLQLALTTLDRAVTLEPLYPLAWFYRGFVAKQLGNIDAAIESYQRLLSFIPYHYETKINLSLIYLQQQRLVDAENLLRDLTNTVGGSREAKAQYVLALTLTKQDGSVKRLQAIDALKRAIRLKPDYIDARIQLVLLETEAGDRANYQRALDQFTQIIELQPNNPSTYFYLGRLHSDAGQFGEAIFAYRKAVQYNPSHRFARKNLGLLLLSQEKWLESQEQFRWLGNNFADDPTNDFNLGRIAYGQRRFDDAIKYYDKALVLAEQNYPEAHLNLGLVYARRGDSQAALAQYEQARQYRQQYPQAWFNEGLVHLRNKNWVDANKAFDLAIEQDPRYEQAWFNLALVYTRQGDTEQAIRAYEEAVKINPSYRAAQLNLAVRYGELGQLNRAIALYKDVLLKDPTYSSAWINLGMAYSKMEDYEAAADALRQAIALDDENIKPRRQLAKVLITVGNFSAAEDLLRQTIDMDMKDTELRLDLARALSVGGDQEQAIGELKIALRLEPENKSLQRELTILEATK